MIEGRHVSLAGWVYIVVAFTAFGLALFGNVNDNRAIVSGLVFLLFGSIVVLAGEMITRREEDDRWGGG